MKSHTIVPGKSVDNLRLGERSTHADSSSSPVTEASVDGVRLALEEGLIKDLWIEFGTAPAEIMVNGKVLRVSRKTPLAEIETALGPCVAVEGIIGGVFFNCESGISIGFSNSGELDQIRVKHR